MPPAHRRPSPPVAGAAPAVTAHPCPAPDCDTSSGRARPSHQGRPLGQGRLRTPFPRVPGSAGRSVSPREQPLARCVEPPTATDLVTQADLASSRRDHSRPAGGAAETLGGVVVPEPRFAALAREGEHRLRVGTAVSSLHCCLAVPAPGEPARIILEVAATDQSRRCLLVAGRRRPRRRALAPRLRESN